MLDQVIHVVWIRKRRLAQKRIHIKLQVILNVSNVILLQIRIGRLANEHCRIFIRRRSLFWSRRVFEQFIDIGDLHLLHNSSQNRVYIKLVWMLFSQSQNGLTLSHSLCFRENVRVGNRNYISVFGKVVAVNFQIRNNIAPLHLIKMPAV